MKILLQIVIDTINYHKATKLWLFCCCFLLTLLLNASSSLRTNENNALQTLDDLGSELSFTQYRLINKDSRNIIALALGDVDNDYDIDVVATLDVPDNSLKQPWSIDSSTKIALYLNNGDGDISDAHYVDSEAKGSHRIALGDMDGDTKIDIVTGGDKMVDKPLNDTTAIHLFKSSVGGTRGLALGDLDGKNGLDIVASSYISSSKIMVYLNGEREIFNKPHVLNMGKSSVLNINLGDIDNQNGLDIVVGSNISPTAIFLNDGLGNFDQPLLLEQAAVGTRSTALGDLNGDGDTDIVMETFTTTISVYLNEGNGKFSTPYYLDGQKGDTQSIALTDWDGDGDIDIVSGNFGSPNALYINDGSGKFSKPYALGPENSQTRSIAVADLDNDGDMDIVAGSSVSRGNVVYLNESTIRWDKLHFLDAEDRQTRSITLGDVDSNGTLDIVASSEVSPTVIYINQGDGVFSSTFTLDLERAGADKIALGDVDGKNGIDIVAGSFMSPTAVYLNEGNGRFDKPYFFDLERIKTSTIVLGDLDNTNGLDIIVGSSVSPTAIYLNQGESHWGIPILLGKKGVGTYSIALGDLDGDNDIDLITGGYEIPNAIYLNDGRGTFSPSISLGAEKSYTQKIALSDMDSDGDLDVVIGRNYGLAEIFWSDGRGNFDESSFFDTESSNIPDIKLGDLDGDGDVDIITRSNSLSASINLYLNKGNGIFHKQSILNKHRSYTLSVALGDINSDGKTDIVAGRSDGPNAFYLNNSQPARIAITQPEQSSTSSSAITLTYTLTDKQAEPIGKIRICYSLVGGGDWRLAVKQGNTMPAAQEIVSPNHRCPYVPAWERGMITPTMTSSSPVTDTFAWDTFASGLFGQSDRVVVRMEVYPYLGPLRNSVPGPFVYPYYAATSLPFSVRGTQVQVVNERGTPVSGALAYQLPAGKSMNGMPISNGATAFHTNGQGYLQGRGTIGLGDYLLALAPQPLPITTTMTWAAGLTDTIHLYYTSGRPTETGVDALIRYSDLITTSIISPGVQLLQVSPAHPLVLFDLRVTLEWDASTDPNQVYLNQLRSDLHKAAEFLYDFTNGQATLGTITVTQNAEDWMFADVFIKATNRLRPLAVQGGVVYTATPDLDLSLGITYTPGQVIMGSTWNRYGAAGQNLGYDWPLALAHELSHYLFFLDDTYLGLNSKGLLTAVDSCVGSVMGDMYNPNGKNTEFIADITTWQAGCSQTLAAKTLQRTEETTRTEWVTIQQRYPPLQSPMPPTMTNPGPSLMPFEFISITVLPPLTPTNTLPDPIIFLDYDGTDKVSSPAARAFLLRDGKLLYDLGTAVGGQNRLLARGARPGDTLCVFDPHETYAGCDVVKNSSEQLTLKETWTPQIEIHPVNTTTLNIQVSALLTTGVILKARLFPELGEVSAPVTLTMTTNGIYSTTLQSAQVYRVENGSVVTVPIASGHVEIWINDTQDNILQPTLTTTRTIVAFSIGGNFGTDPTLWAVGPHIRAGGPHIRAGGPHIRAGGPLSRGSNAPVASSDGQLIFFTADATTFREGDLYTIQSVAAFPVLPTNTKPVGLLYSLIASANAQIITGSVSFQYLGIDALSLGITEADEQGLSIYYCCDEHNGWHPLPTAIDPRYNLASALSKGAGFYALLARSKTFSVESAQANLTSGSQVLIEIYIQNYDSDTLVILTDCDGVSYPVQPVSISDTTISINLKKWPPGTYTVTVLKDNHVTSNSVSVTVPGDSQKTCPP